MKFSEILIAMVIFAGIMYGAIKGVDYLQSKEAKRDKDIGVVYSKSPVVVHRLKGEWAREFYLSDGTLCVTWSDEAITCRWD